jgi:hypothetical protein
VVLAVEDDFPTDNQAYSVLQQASDVWVLLVTKGNYFLEAVLNAFPNFMVNTLEEIVPSSWPEQTLRHDIVILDRIAPPSVEHGNFLLIDTIPPSLPLTRTGRLNQPEIMSWNPDSPLMANLDLSGLYIESAGQVDTIDSLKPHLSSRETGLIYSYEKNDLRAVYLGFDITQSDLPLKVAFPVLMNNIFDWLRPHHLRFSARQIKTGDPFTTRLSPGSHSISVKTPSGKWREYTAQSGSFSYRNTGEAGLYTIVEKDQWRYFAVNLVDAAESDIRPPTDRDRFRQQTGQTVKEQTTLAAMNLWPYFLFVFFILLVVEWFAWTRNR